MSLLNNIFCTPENMPHSAVWMRSCRDYGGLSDGDKGCWDRWQYGVVLIDDGGDEGDVAGGEGGVGHL